MLKSLCFPLNGFSFVLFFVTESMRYGAHAELLACWALPWKVRTFIGFFSSRISLDFEITALEARCTGWTKEITVESFSQVSHSCLRWPLRMHCEVRNRRQSPAALSIGTAARAKLKYIRSSYRHTQKRNSEKEGTAWMWFCIQIDWFFFFFPFTPEWTIHRSGQVSKVILTSTSAKK